VSKVIDKVKEFEHKMCKLNNITVSMEPIPWPTKPLKLHLSFFAKEINYGTEVSLTKEEVFRLCDFFTECKKQLENLEVKDEKCNN
jgi:hypothetical protein